MKKNKQYSDDTIIQHLGEDRIGCDGAIVPPIYQNSLFAFESWDAIDKAFDNPDENYIYTRGNNPTNDQVEKKLAALAGGEKAKLFASGMGAISSAVMSCIQSGSHIIAVKNTYGPASNFMGTYLVEKFGIEVTYVEGKNTADFINAAKETTTLIYLESPSSAVMSLQNIEEVAKFARAKGINTIIDNTWATFLYQKPLAMGIDIEVHSCSKYISGHSDLVAGVLITSKERMKSIFTNEAALFGAKSSPFEAWLIQRGLRTLPIRLERISDNTKAIVKYLESNDKVEMIYYPGCKYYDQNELLEKQMSGTTGLLSFEIKCDEVTKLKDFVNEFELFSIAVGWGGHESLVYAPAISYLKEMSPEKFAMLGISLGTIRISVGLESAQDLIDDLESAFSKL